MRANGAYTALVSGGFTAFTASDRRGDRLPREPRQHLVIEDGGHCRRVAEPILGREAKLETLVELRSACGSDRTDTLAVGDGANDLP